MFGDDMCEDMCVWRRYVSEYVCWPTVPPISRCSEANVWSSRMVQPPSSTVRLEVRCTRTHGNHSPTMYSARQRTGRTAPRTRTPLNAQGHRARRGISALTTRVPSSCMETTTPPKCIDPRHAPRGGPPGNSKFAQVVHPVEVGSITYK